MVMLTLGTGCGGGAVIDGQALPRLGGVRPHGGRVRRRALPGHVHGPRAPRGVRHRDGGDEARAGGVRAGGRRAPARPARATRATPRAIEILAEIGRHLGAGIGDARQHLRSRARRDRRRVRGRRRLRSRPGARGRARATRCAGPASACSIVRARARHGGRPDRRRASSRFEVAGASAARRLRDADREPRRRHAARARRAARRRRRPLRGHAAHARAARAARHLGAAALATTSTTRRSGPRELLPRLDARRARSRSSRTPGCPAISDPGRGSWRPRSTRACP